MAVQTFVRILGCCISGLLVLGLGFGAVAVGILQGISWIAFLGPVLGMAGTVIMLIGWMMFQDLYSQLPAPVEPQ